MEVRVMIKPKAQFWFWWKDWDLYYDKPVRAIKQRTWKLQIGFLMFTLWRKRR